MSHHRWLLKILADQFHMEKIIFRYNYNVISKLNPADVGHHLECHIKPQNNQAKTVLFVGPYDSLDDAQSDIQYLTSEYRCCHKHD